MFIPTWIIIVLYLIFIEITLPITLVFIALWICYKAIVLFIICFLIGISYFSDILKNNPNISIIFLIFFLGWGLFYIIKKRQEIKTSPKGNFIS